MEKADRKATRITVNINIILLFIALPHAPGPAVEDIARVAVNHGPLGLHDSRSGLLSLRLVSSPALIQQAIKRQIHQAVVALRIEQNLVGVAEDRLHGV